MINNKTLKPYIDLNHIGHNIIVNIFGPLNYVWFEWQFYIRRGDYTKEKYKRPDITFDEIKAVLTSDEWKEKQRNDKREFQEKKKIQEEVSKKHPINIHNNDEVCKIGMTALREKLGLREALKYIGLLSYDEIFDRKYTPKLHKIPQVSLDEIWARLERGVISPSLGGHQRSNKAIAVRANLLRLLHQDNTF